MDLHLTDKHVLITGGSKGIGLACAQGFLAEGAKVTLVSRDPGNLTAAVKILKADYPASSVHTIAADMQIAANGEQVLNQAEQHFGAVDILVNSAGAAKRTAPDDLNPEAWQAAMQAKYFSYIHMIDPTIKRMGQRGAGAIVNVIGAGGKVASAIHMPGGAANARAQGITAQEAMQRANARIPMGRIARAEEVADAVVYLASARASYISGVVLTMDGCTTAMVV